MLRRLMLGAGLALTAVAWLTMSPAEAKLVAKDIDYTAGGKPMQGYLVYNDVLVKPGHTPGILVYHAWMGIGRHEKEWSNQLAALGYVVFAPDIYGKGVRPTTPEAAGKQATIYRNNRPLMRSRAAAGLQILQKQPWVDAHRIGAIGFCFGGGVALELARSGAPVAGTVSLHGNLDTPHPADARQIKGKVLALHGADDPLVKADQVAAFKQEMTQAKVDWQFKAYAGAVHAFTDPYVGTDKSKGVAYHPQAAQQAWNDMTAFFAKLFA